jgi:TPR repeat protein
MNRMKIFLSYRINDVKNEDIAFIDKIKKRINTIRDITLFIDNGNRTWEEVERGIKNSNSYILILTKDVIELYGKKIEQKDTFIRQIELANDLRINIFPIRFPSYIIDIDKQPEEINDIPHKVLYFNNNDFDKWFDSQILEEIIGRSVDREEEVKVKLKIKSDVDCIVKIDGKEVGSINAKNEVPFILELKKGEYDLVFINKNNYNDIKKVSPYKIDTNEGEKVLNIVFTKLEHKTMYALWSKELKLLCSQNEFGDYMQFKLTQINDNEVSFEFLNDKIIRKTDFDDEVCSIDGIDYKKGFETTQEGIAQSTDNSSMWKVKQQTKIKYINTGNDGNISLYEQAENYYYGKNGIKQDYVTAMKIYKTLAEKNDDSNAQERLGICYYLGDGFVKSDTKALYWFKLAIEKGGHNVLEQGIKIIKRRRLNIIKMIAFILLDLIFMLFAVFMFTLYNGKPRYVSVLIDILSFILIITIPIIFNCILKLEIRYMQSLFISSINEKLNTLEKNKLDNHIYKIADKEYKHKKNVLKNIFIAVIIFLIGNISTFNLVSLYRFMAQRGNIDAQLTLAKFYDDSSGFLYSNTKAVYWYTKAANNRSLDAKLQLGDLYEQRIYNSSNIKEFTDNINASLYWNKEAYSQCQDTITKNNIIDCYMYLADEYYLGTQFKNINYKLAFQYYMKAANLGCGEAQYKVGECYRLGCGVKQNKAISTVWYKRAKQSGYTIK